MATRFLVGIPTVSTYRSVLWAFITCLKSMDYPSFDVLFVDNSDTEEYCEHIRALGYEAVWNHPVDERKMGKILSNRQVIVERCISGGYDHLLFLDQDVMAPPDTLSKLAGHGKPICGGVYLSNMRHGDAYAVGPVAVAMTAQEGFVKRLTVDAVMQPRLLEAAGVGFGCCLISREVLQQVPIRVNFEQGSTEDWLTCHDARKQGFKTYLDTSIWCEHWSKGRVLCFDQRGNVVIHDIPPQPSNQG